MTTYKDAGVDVEAGYEAVRLMRNDVKGHSGLRCLLI